MKTKTGKTIYVIAFDFDETIAATFGKSAAGVGVNEAYKMASSEVFGAQGAELFTAVGGLKNRDAHSLTLAMLDSGDKPALLSAAQNYLATCNGHLKGLVPEGKGRPLVWSQIQASAVTTELLVQVKLRILAKQIGTPCHDDAAKRWPQPCPGFARLWECIALFNVEYASCGLEIVPVIISSGHHNFICECFALWGLTPPKFMVTDDDMRSPAYDHLSVAQRSKPSPSIFRVFCRQLLEAEDGVQNGDLLHCIDGKGLLAGDCLTMDKGLADNSLLSFLWFNHRMKVRPTGLNGASCSIIEIHDWTQVVNRLLVGKAVTMMRTGQPMGAILHKVF